MEQTPLPPPLPEEKKRRIWPIVLITLGVFLVIGFASSVAWVFAKVQKKGVERKAALQEVQRTAAEEREKIAQSIEKGEVTGGGDSIARVKEQVDKSAALMSKNDAAAMRGVSAYLAKMQAQAKIYEQALGSLLKAEVLAFKVKDRAQLAEYRKIVTDFSAANDRLTEIVKNGDQLLRAELAAAKVPSATLEATMTGFNKNRDQRLMQVRIRECDRVLGDASLAAIDLLDKEWGKWNHDSASGQLVFQSDASMKTFNDLMEKVKKAGADQEKAQQELAQKMRAASSPALGK